MKNVLVVALLLASGFALADSVTIGGYTWRCSALPNGQYSTVTNGFKITGVDPASGDLVMPSEIRGYPVLSINYAAFSGCSDITSMAIASTVVDIGNSAFKGCTGLKSIVIPNGVTYLPMEAFRDCSGLVDVKFGTGLKQIQQEVFSGCSSLKAVVIPDSVTEIGWGAFQYCGSLERLSISAQVTSNLSGCFAGCNSIKDLVIPPAVSKISEVFYSSYLSVSNVALVGDWTSLPRGMFAGCKSLESVVLPNGITKIEQEVFWECDKLASIELPETVTSIGGYSFAKTALRRIELPRTTTCVDEGAFTDCASLLEVVFHGDAPSVCGKEIYKGTPVRLTTYVPEKSVGWVNAASEALPEIWQDRAIKHSGETWSGDPTPVPPSHVYLTISNIVIHYVNTSIEPKFANPPSDDTGFVNIITEVKGGCVAIPESWKDDYPSFVSKFGPDFTKALAAKTGKRDGAGNEMFVWQDYIAGTDPTDETSVFTASITIAEGKVTISYSPELDDARKAMRKYTTWGKTSLMDADWTEVQEGHEVEYNFFKVSVEMR